MAPRVATSKMGIEGSLVIEPGEELAGLLEWAQEKVGEFGEPGDEPIEGIKSLFEAQLARAGLAERNVTDLNAELAAARDELSQLKYEAELRQQSEAFLKRIRKYWEVSDLHEEGRPPVFHDITDLPLIVGRHQYNIGSERIAKQHAVIGLQENPDFTGASVLYIENLGTDNLTYVNGRRVPEGKVVLRHGDYVSFGNKDLNYIILKDGKRYFLAQMSPSSAKEVGDGSLAYGRFISAQAVHDIRKGIELALELNKKEAGIDRLEEERRKREADIRRLGQERNEAIGGERKLEDALRSVHDLLDNASFINWRSRVNKALDVVGRVLAAGRRSGE